MFVTHLFAGMPPKTVLACYLTKHSPYLTMKGDRLCVSAGAATAVRDWRRVVKLRKRRFLTFKALSGELLEAAFEEWKLDMGEATECVHAEAHLHIRALREAREWLLGHEVWDSLLTYGMNAMLSDIKKDTRCWRKELVRDPRPNLETWRGGQLAMLEESWAEAEKNLKTIEESVDLAKRICAAWRKL